MDLRPLIPAIVFGIVMSWLARRKGYRWWVWFYAMGLVGLLVLGFMPFANKPEQTPEERARLVKRGNRVGLVLSGIAVAITLALFGFSLWDEFGSDLFN